MTGEHRKMRVRSVAMRLWAALALCLTQSVGQAAQEPAPASVAFWYAQNPPLAELAQFDWAVVEPGHMTPADVRELLKDGGHAFAYLSIGELSGDQNDEQARRVREQAASATQNAAWNSQVMDITLPAWRNYLFKRAADLQAQGYSGLFLDTLDSFQLLPEASREPQRLALVSFLRELHQRQPGLKLFFNRGFEVLPDLDGVAAGVAVESIRNGWDAAAKNFRPVPEADRQWLEGQLKPLQARGLPVIAIDYLPPGNRAQMRTLARQLHEEGYIPYVTSPELDALGISTIEVQPRRIAMLYDPREGDLARNAGQRMVGGLLEYMGYRVDYLAADDSLPDYRFSGLYAGVMSWMTSGPPANSQAFNAWLGKRLDEQVPLAFISGLPIEDKALLKRLGLTLGPRMQQPALHLISQDKSLIGAFEAPVELRTRELDSINTLPGGPTAALRVGDDQGHEFTPVLTGSWGGLAVMPYVIDENPERSRWILDPFAFLQKALRLPQQPRPDATTENGRRIATVHLDGDGFASRSESPGTPYSGEQVLEQFIKPYPFLTSVSLIEAELSPHGAYPQLSHDLEPIARKVFAEPKVEVATHTFSHPFFMQPEVAEQGENFSAEYGLDLKIPGYDKIDFKREIVGSRDYINKNLTTPNKPVKMVFWPGDALPGPDTVKLAYDAGLLNVNGGKTIMTRGNPSLTGLYPLLRPTAGGLQYYAPITNENVYTNLWKGPYYGFRDVLDTFAMTDSPRRLRGLNLYYHFYSGTKQASVKVIQEVYRYMVDQQPLSLWMSDYLSRVHGLYSASLARTLDGAWQVRGLEGLRTLRLDPQMGWPDLSLSQGVAGVRDLAQGRYVHLSSDQAVLVLRPDRDPRPALEEANLPLKDWRYLDDHQVQFSFAGEMELSFSVRAAGTCRVQTQDQRFVGKADKGLWHFQLPLKQVTDAHLICY
jgi:uncharacterized protein (TIGR01370 family)